MIVLFIILFALVFGVVFGLRRLVGKSRWDKMMQHSIWRRRLPR